MQQAYTQLDVHLVWATWNRMPLGTEEFRHTCEELESTQVPPRKHHRPSRALSFQRRCSRESAKADFVWLLPRFQPPLSQPRRNR
jgi:hypothetical protein